MSIFPKEVNSSSGNSTQFISSNSLPDDGILQSPRSLCNSIADKESYPTPVFFMEPLGSSGSIDEVAVDSFDSSSQVTDLGILDGQTSFHGEIHVASSESLLDRQEKISSQVHIEFTGNGCSTHFEQMAASRNPHGNLIPSTSRKNHKISGNHLLNFQYDPILTRPQSKVHPPRKQQKPKPYNKDLFLQANYKFIILDRGTSTMLSLDPDKLLQWEDVLCVRYSTPFEVQCPICLETPLCPQITTCGHIFCFPCILRYLLMGVEDHKGENWKRCPLCLMMISCKDLYTLYIDSVTLYGVGDLVNFMLLTRPKNSLLLSQKDQNGISCDALCERFSRFTLTSDVELSVRAAKLELSQWLAKAETGMVQNLEQIPYVCAALEQLEQRKNLWVEYEACSDILPIRDHSPSYSTKFSKYSTPKHETNPTLILAPTSVMADDETHDLSSALIFDDSHELNWPESNGTSAKGSNVEDGIHEHLTDFACGKETESYTFYQSVDGQNLILHPLNMKCLLYHFGSYDLLPPRLSGEILQLETVIQCEVMRKRYRYLSHLPLTTSFQLCEINLRDILPPPAFSPFIDEIKKRENQRKRLAKKEQEQKARAEALDTVSRKSDCHRSLQNNPGFSLDDFEALGGYAMSSSSPPVGEKKLFADVTRLGFAAAHDSPSLKNDSPSGTSTKIASGGHSNSNTSYQRNPSNSSFAAIINKSSQNIPVQQTKRLEKKGKKQSRVLFSTAGGRHY